MRRGNLPHGVVDIWATWELPPKYIGWNWKIRVFIYFLDDFSEFPKISF